LLYCPTAAASLTAWAGEVGPCRFGEPCEGELGDHKPDPPDDWNADPGDVWYRLPEEEHGRILQKIQSADILKNQ
jgi:hypothetical protein